MKDFRILSTILKKSRGKNRPCSRGLTCPSVDKSFIFNFQFSCWNNTKNVGGLSQLKQIIGSKNNFVFTLR
jgi:hypothetical protein